MPSTARRATSRSARSPSMKSTPATCVEVAALARDRLSTTRTSCPRQEFFRQVRADEAGTAGDEICAMCLDVPGKCARLRRNAPAARASQPTDKPNSVPPTPGGLAGGDHSSRAAIAGGLKRPTRRLRTGRPQPPPYLVLLRAGFCLPRSLPTTRCALTAPFHPYPSTRAPCRRLAQGGIFSVPLSVGLPRPGVTRRTALWSSDFPLRPAHFAARSRPAQATPRASS